MFVMLSNHIATSVDWSKLSGPFAVGVAVILVVLVIGHFIAAKLLMPEPGFLRVIGAVFLHIAFGAVVFPLSLFLSLSGLNFFALASLIVLILGGAVTAGIYKVGIGRGIVYNLAVLLAVTGVTWGTSELLASKYSPLVYFYPKAASPAEGASPDSARETGRLVQSENRNAPTSAHSFATSQEAQAAALKLYPDLGKAGTSFNTSFLAKHRGYRDRNDPILNSPDWPLMLEREVAGELVAR